MDDLKEPLLARDHYHGDHHQKQQQQVKDCRRQQHKDQHDQGDDDDSGVDDSNQRGRRDNRELREQQQQIQQKRRVFLHVVAVPLLLIVQLYSIPCPFLGLYLPVLYFSVIGYTLPAELFLGCTTLIAMTCLVGTMDVAYKLLLVFAAMMTSLIGWKKFQQMQKMELEHSRKKHDDDDDDQSGDGDEHNAHGTKSKLRRVPVAPGPELDALRSAETRRRRERKQERLQDDRNIAAYVGIPIEKFDAIV